MLSSLLTGALAAGACGATLRAQVTIRLTDVPEQLSYPIPAGQNSMLTAAIEGGAVDSVWLATEADAAADRRVALTRTAADRFQLNLGAVDVETLLRRRGRRGEFRVFARTASGATVASPSVRFTFGGRHQTLPSWVAKLRDGQRSGHAYARRTPWLSPTETLEIVYDYGREDPTTPVEALAGNAAWPLRIDPPTRSARLTVTPEIRAAWESEGTLRVRPESGTEIAFRARPVRLRFAGTDARMTIVQRRRAEVPGSGGWLWVRIGDITRGQVLLDMRTDEGSRVIRQRSVRKGDAVSFRVGEEDYVLRVERLANLLIGDDYGEFTIAKSKWSEQDRIDALLAALERSDLTFLRGDGEFTGLEAAAHLRRKLEFARAEVSTVEEFIHRIASRSSTTGKPYRVRSKDGRTTDVAEWMFRELRALDANRQAPADGGR